ncbi:hypothetical protein [Rhabdochromatium marinum]|uniref:hypothetical protein n=1 Tax=Rhabdochromatium marinum TaxID=48729 RepID=UPI001906FD09|nr:hypothetical protein [Rhabdochromatium marinum]
MASLKFCLASLPVPDNHLHPKRMLPQTLVWKGYKIRLRAAHQPLKRILFDAYLPCSGDESILKTILLTVFSVAWGSGMC